MKQRRRTAVRPAPSNLYFGFEPTPYVLLMTAGQGLQRPNRKRIVGATRGVREGRPSTDGGITDPDFEILELVSRPFDSIDDAHSRLCALESLFRERGDRRGAFLVVYARVTEEVGRAIRNDEFNDARWAADYLVSFADLYRRALLAYEQGDLTSVPDPWQIAFETAVRGDCLVAQDVVLGINAHVNYDLALALHAVDIHDDQRTRYEDHLAINRILQQLVDEVQDLLVQGYAPGIARIDEALGRFDEVFGFFTLREGRDNAWRTAVALNSRFVVRRLLARWILRTASTGAAYVILTPNLSGSAYETLRRVEQQETGQEYSP